jgi:hypothetical protein
MFKYMVNGLVDPVKEVGADSSHVVFSILLSTANRLRLNWVVTKVESTNLKPYICSHGGSKVLVGIISSEVLASLGFTDCVKVEMP